MFNFEEFQRKQEEDKKRYQLICESIKQTQENSMKTIQSCENSLDKIQEAIKGAQETQERIDNFKNKFNEILNSLAENIGSSFTNSGFKIPGDPNDYKGPQAKKSSIEEVVKLLVEAKNIVFLTGAGISAASGVPTFRGKGGFWTSGEDTYEAQQVLTSKFLNEKPQLCWGWHKDFQNIVKSKKPNANHFAISELHLFMEKHFKEQKTFNLITQNIDGFHSQTYPQEFKKFGFNKYLHEIHGNINYLRCDKYCQDEDRAMGNLYQMPDLNIDPIPNCPKCSDKSHPHILFFDESYDEPYYFRDTVKNFMVDCDILIVIGTQLETGLSASILKDAIKKNKIIVEINPEPIIEIGNTYTLQGNAEDFIPKICKNTIEILSKTFKNKIQSQTQQQQQPKQQKNISNKTAHKVQSTQNTQKSQTHQNQSAHQQSKKPSIVNKNK